MVKRFVDKADQTTRDAIEKLVAGGFVEKQLRLDLTYDEIDNKMCIRDRYTNAFKAVV